MKITVELPDWAKERHIYIFGGVELLAFKEHGTDWFRIKEKSCDMCGKCCEDAQFIQTYDSARGRCEYLEEVGDEKRCSLGSNRPFSCSVGDPMTLEKGPWKDCCITFEERKDSTGETRE
jgi:hypothetical protein